MVFQVGQCYETHAQSAKEIRANQYQAVRPTVDINACDWAQHYSWYREGDIQEAGHLRGAVGVPSDLCGALMHCQNCDKEHKDSTVRKLRENLRNPQAHELFVAKQRSITADFLGLRASWFSDLRSHEGYQCTLTIYSTTGGHMAKYLRPFNQASSPSSPPSAEVTFRPTTPRLLVRKNSRISTISECC